MNLACHYVDDLGPCDLEAIGTDQRHAFTCERHGFIGGQTLTLFNREEGLRKLKEQAIAFVIASALDGG